jgi:hypothetical protein
LDSDEVEKLTSITMTNGVRSGIVEHLAISKPNTRDSDTSLLEREFTSRRCFLGETTRGQASTLDGSTNVDITNEELLGVPGITPNKVSNDYGVEFLSPLTSLLETSGHTPTAPYRPSLSMGDFPSEEVCVKEDLASTIGDSRLVLRDKLEIMIKTVSLFFPESSLNDLKLRELIEKSIEAQDLVYNKTQAVEWADGFEFVPSVWEKDWEDLERLDFNLSELVKERNSIQKPFRFNQERLSNWSGASDLKELQSLVEGMKIHCPLPPVFQPSEKPQRLRKTYLDVAPAIHKMIYDLHQKGAVLILPTSKLVNVIPDLHYSVTSWATKKGKPQGRLITDPSFGDPEVKPLNSPEAKEMVRNAWGEINHPTLEDLVNMILEVISVYGQENICLWKQDLANAFGLLDVDPDSAHLLANSLKGDLTYIYLVGFFG